MATKIVCDRCGADITKVTSAAIQTIPNADPDHNGKFEYDHDICIPCYKEFCLKYEAWLRA